MGFLGKLFGGSKSEKDVKKIQPLVQQINQHFSSYASLTNDELRNKTQDFKKRIAEHLSEIDATIKSKTAEAEALPATQIAEKDEIFQEVDKLKKQRDEELEVILKQILPEAFAVVKETARRFKDNENLVATATQLDRDLSVKKQYVTINGDEVTFANSWTAGGNVVTWNMVHYLSLIHI